MNKPGFYKNDSNILLYSPTTVESSGYYLSFHTKENYEYPVDGWYWFDDEIIAREFFNLPLIENEPQLL